MVRGGARGRRPSPNPSAGGEVFYGDLTLRDTADTHAWAEVLCALRSALDAEIEREEIVDALRSGDPRRHTFGRLYMSARGAELSRLQRIMGHTSPETTSRYVFHPDVELAAEHQLIERLQSDPLARRQDHRRTRAAARGSSSTSRD